MKKNTKKQNYEKPHLIEFENITSKGVGCYSGSSASDDCTTGYTAAGICTIGTGFTA